MSICLDTCSVYSLLVNSLFSIAPVCSESVNLPICLSLYITFPCSAFYLQKPVYQPLGYLPIYLLSVCWRDFTNNLCFMSITSFQSWVVQGSFVSCRSEWDRERRPGTATDPGLKKPGEEDIPWNQKGANLKRMQGNAISHNAQLASGIHCHKDSTEAKSIAGFKTNGTKNNIQS